LLGAIVSAYVLDHRTNAADEWANTYQAALFAKGHAYGHIPPCVEAFRSWWIVEYMGRTFAQYTPGWPSFMTPFVAVGAAWLAGPFAFGLLVVGIARLARRAAATGFSEVDRARCSHEARASGILAGLVATLGSTMLLNAGSRYPHIFVAATYAWSVEALCAVASKADGGERSWPKRPWAWGIALGALAALMLSTRPGDGAMLGIGLLAYFGYALLRGRVPWQSIAGGAFAFGLIGGVTLVILRLQMGRWFVTGYALNADVKWSPPDPNDYKWGLPFGTGSYCWWPCSPAVGIAGLAIVGRSARRIAIVFLISFVPFFAFYTLSEVGRGHDDGYGPRYELPFMVPMAVGTGIILARLCSSARMGWKGTRALRTAGPALVALTAAVVGTAVIAPLVYPYNRGWVLGRNRLRVQIDRAGLRNAVVLVGDGAGLYEPLPSVDAMDLIENLPLDLYPQQDVIVALSPTPVLEQCVRQLYPNRSFYRALPGEPIRIVPY
jgi:hypothetical protein